VNQDRSSLLCNKTKLNLHHNKNDESEIRVHIPSRRDYSCYCLSRVIVFVEKGGKLIDQQIHWSQVIPQLFSFRYVTKSFYTRTNKKQERQQSWRVMRSKTTRILAKSKKDSKLDRNTTSHDNSFQLIKEKLLVQFE
jgi:hypothetical protein